MRACVAVCGNEKIHGNVILKNRSRTPSILTGNFFSYVACDDRTGVLTISRLKVSYDEHTSACYTRAQCSAYCSAYSPRISTGPRLGDRNIPERRQLRSSSGPAPSVLPPARGMHGITSYALQLVGIVSCKSTQSTEKIPPAARTPVVCIH